MKLFMKELIIRIRCLGLLLLSALACIPIQAAERANPNIVVILADDLGWMDVAAYAARARGVERSDCYYETPHIDQLADQGMLFVTIQVPWGGKWKKGLVLWEL